MALDTIKNLLHIKDILRALLSSGTNKYIKILKKQRSRKNSLEETRQNGTIR